MATWHTTASVRADWPDAEQISDPTLTELLNVAQGQVIAYAPRNPGGAATVTLTAGVATLALVRTGSLVTAALTRNDPAVNATFVLPGGFGASIEVSYSFDESGNWGWASVNGTNAQVSKLLPDGVTFVYTTADTPSRSAIPDAWRLAQRMQAQNLYNAARVDSNGAIGDGGDFVIKPHPLDWHVKGLLRPNRGRPRVG